MVRVVEEASRADPVLATILSGDMKYIGHDELLLAGRKWRADKFELKVPLHAPVRDLDLAARSAPGICSGKQQ
jgi:hypothetical protein